MMLIKKMQILSPTVLKLSKVIPKKSTETAYSQNASTTYNNQSLS